MTNQAILSHIDHTLLKATASRHELQALCSEALEFRTASVCIPPCAVAFCYESFPGLTIGTVIGFPLGYNTTKVKVAEAEEALADGASELDMVINLSAVKSGDFSKVQDEIAALKRACGNKILKVIIEACYLSQEEKIRLCGIVSDAGADYIKTSTGFGSGGAVLEDIHTFKQHIGPHVKIKAAGGIKQRADIEAFLNAGCERIGTSSAVKLLTQG
ncbi:deoxyribose-phosphate aldolase [Breznakiellaceae bacterium SP9]